MTTLSKTNNWTKREAKLEEVILKYCIKHGFNYRERLDRIGLVLNISEFIETAISKAKEAGREEEAERRRKISAKTVLKRYHKRIKAGKCGITGCNRNLKSSSRCAFHLELLRKNAEKYYKTRSK